MRYSVAIYCTCCSIALTAQGNEIAILTEIEDHARDAGWRFFDKGVRGGAWACGRCVRFHNMTAPPPVEPSEGHTDG